MRFSESKKITLFFRFFPFFFGELSLRFAGGSNRKAVCHKKTPFDTLVAPLFTLRR